MSSKIKKKKKVIESRCFCGLRNRFVVSFLRILIDFSYANNGNQPSL